MPVTPSTRFAPAALAGVPAMVAPSALAAADGEAQVLTLLRQGTPVPAVSDATTWPAAAIRKLAARNKMLISADGIAYSPDAAYYARQVETIGQASLAELLKLAEACVEPKVRQALSRLRHDAQLLREHLIAHERTKADLVVAKQAAAEAGEEIERLAAQLEAAKGRLREATQTIGRHDRQTAAKLTRASTGTKAGAAGTSAATPRRYQPGVDYSTPEARAWAKANGHGEALPVSGRYVPDHVIDAMRAAQPGQGDQPVRGQAQPSAAQEVAA
ncbi:hypothetical protein AB0K21_42345 [Streptosporangium sp. NPDC049248]|uniref:hypothetical protein n=1 Tax=Streptosporangium sp. NPDC049248 TaxID=3155651 RepID=UPI00343D808D